MLDNKEDLMTCECGSVFFEDIRAKTFLSNRFVFYGDATRSQLQHEDIAIPVAKCLFCGKVHIPGTSFSGMNQMNRNVQLYAELIEFQKNFLIAPVVVEVGNVKTEPDSEVDPQHVVRRSQGRGKSSKASKE